MKKHLRLDVTDASLYPGVVELLRHLPSSVLFHRKYSFRHPAAIYLLSLRQLAYDFTRVLDGYSALRSGAVPFNKLDEQMSQSQRILIYSLREHLDDCQMILMCFVDPDSIPYQGRSPDEMLKSAGFKERKIFWDGVHNYSNSYLMPLVNALKHSQGRLRTFVFENSPSDIRPGFYLEEMDENEVAQPSAQLHQSDSAFSYARDIRNNLALVFRAAESLKDAISTAMKRLSVATTSTTDGPGVQPSLWTDVCKRVASLDDGVFPQETKDSFIRFSQTAEGTLQIRELDRDFKLSFPSTAKCHAMTLGDGMTKSFRMPYLGKKSIRK
jgi:hypothetical protein